MTISGGKLTVGSNPVSVDFNGTPATFTISGTEVRAVVPAGATTGPVHVKTSYVDSRSPGGTATSPYDFTVVQSVFTEAEPNDSRAAAGNAGAAQVLNGAIGGNDPADWFRIDSGPGGPWGYAIEIVATPQVLPSGVSLRVDMEGFRADLGAVGNLTTYQDTGTFTLWTTQAPGNDIYLNVRWTGTGPAGGFSAPYKLTVARIPIQDSNESDDSYQSARTITMTNGQGSHAGSYLCNIMRGGADVGMQDFYAFSGGGAEIITVGVSAPSLDASDKVVLDLSDGRQAQGYRGGDQGNSSAASVILQLTDGETAEGTWYIEVSNGSDHYATAGAGPGNRMPSSCKAPYIVGVSTQ